MPVAGQLHAELVDLLLCVSKGLGVLAVIDIRLTLCPLLRQVAELGV